VRQSLDPVRQASVRACVWVPWVCGRQAPRGVLEEKPKGLGRDANATSRPRRVVTARSEAVAGSWRGDGGCGAGCVARQG
jgi:hypothetical protein